MPYRKLINHVAGSYAYFIQQAIKYNLPEKLQDLIGHCILSHHGRREWGSPVEPITPEAFILHSADMLSATSYTSDFDFLRQVVKR